MANKCVFLTVKIILIISHLIKINAEDQDPPCFAQYIYPPCKEVGQMVVDCIVNLRCDYKVTIFNELEPNSTIRECIENWITECAIATHANPLMRCIDKTFLVSKRYQATGLGAPCKNYFGLPGYCEYMGKCDSAKIEYNTHSKSNLYLQYIQDSNCNTEEELVLCCTPSIDSAQVPILLLVLLFILFTLFLFLYLHERKKSRLLKRKFHRN